MGRKEYLHLLENIKNASERNITLVAVSKNVPMKAFYEIYNAGQRYFGENRLPQCIQKIEEAPKDCVWHYIGPLQSNKINKALSRFSLIHTIDTPDLAKKVAKASKERGMITNILLQANTSGELTKQGLNPEEWLKSFEEIKDLEGIHIQGLMTMAPFVQDEKIVRDCFAKLRELRDRLEKEFGVTLPDLSMGMSNDYLWAIQEGATILRIGSAIFAPNIR